MDKYCILQIWLFRLVLRSRVEVLYFMPTLGGERKVFAQSPAGFLFRHVMTPVLC